VIARAGFGKYKPSTRAEFGPDFDYSPGLVGKPILETGNKPLYLRNKGLRAQSFEKSNQKASILRH
jgi:hypothetical protein